jgi:sugar (pentulose or hexulose) kinase
MHDLIAVLDVGKTHAKLSLVEAAAGQVLSQTRRVNSPGWARGMRQLDLEAMQVWLLATLAALPQKARITALVPVGHGAACVLVDDRGQVLAAPDYEDHCFEATAADYDGQRGPFAETLSPRLPGGLNLGAQLHHLESATPDLWARTQLILLLPQYWAWRLCGVAACEVSSLGTHTDLWRPQGADFSALARRRGWRERFPPLRPAGAVLGHLTPEVATATGLPATCEVLCGVHDSNASWLAQRRRIGQGAELSVVASGTWTIVMSSRSELERLHENRDMLANVDVFGVPVTTARFMGGREYAAIAGADPATPTLAALQAVISTGAMALPSFAEAGGPFQGQRGRLVGADDLSPVQRAALATLYVALVTELMLELLGPTRTVVVDGPFAANPLYPGLLKALWPGVAVIVDAPSAGGAAAMSTGVTAGALALVLRDAAPADATQPQPVEALRIDGLADYRSAWRALCLVSGGTH